MARMRNLVSAIAGCGLLVGHVDASRLAHARTPIPVPVERASNVFFARTTVNGVGPFWFTVDTGATLTVIDPDAAKRAGLVVRNTGRRPNVGVTAGDVSTATTAGARIEVGGVPGFAPPYLYVVAVRANAGYLGHTVDGVLGTDFLRRYIIEFHYAESRSLASTVLYRVKPS